MAGRAPSATDVLDTIQHAAPFLRWHVRLDYSHAGERIVAVGGSPRTRLTPEEAREEAVRVFRIADKAAHCEPAEGVTLDVHVVASDGLEYGSEPLA